MAYTDAHRLFLQSLISNRFMTDEAVGVSWNSACNLANMVDAGPFRNHVVLFNEKLNQLDISLEYADDPEDPRKIYWFLINTRGDAIAQLATAYEQSEIAFFKHIIDKIMRHPRKAFDISRTNALSEANNVEDATRKLKASETETLITKLIGDGWLRTDSSRRYLSLGVRSLIELRPYVLEQYGDEEDAIIVKCTSCNKPIMSPNWEYCRRADEEEGCNCRLHRRCAENLRNNGGNIASCPVCQSPWYGNPNRRTE